MKKINHYIGMLALIVLCFGACKKNSYLTDGGLEKAATPFSTYDYLKNNKYHQFDTLLTLIDFYKLKDTINNSKTFFAPPDMAINSLMKSITIKRNVDGAILSSPITTFKQLTDSVSANLLKQYIFNKTITLDEATTASIIYTNEAGAIAPCAIKKVIGASSVYLSNSALTFSYYTLEYVVINGLLDGSSGPSPDDKVDALLPCQTTGIQTSTGTTLHVLANFAVLKKL
ncbi:hypothetical protein BDD43_0594 [Mucilaginibacter gracilis]|uniref:FAS1 domain-containing protein n=2 Tax=Mucilaginibacter TaxID=423349 RepID=H1YIH3_9SPHI|nr:MULTISPECIES: hypothetical protein [Mucilaginibacter]EHQ26539.1 hypothetical protein Mucpa_2416 [Mucilaginibacter paludis DSM 18603]RKR80478.1 hypothetical protein BDD43_0594 [Mucilaginibacter gracilis]